MGKSRIVLISRRFWPLVGGAERAMAGLASQFHNEGHQVKVLTAKWEPQWPSEIVHREVPVVRLPHPKTRGWGTLRYMSQIKNWLKENHDQYDAVLVSMLKHDAYAATKATKRLKKPTIVRAEGGGPTGDCEFHRTARFGNRIKQVCKTAEAIIAPSQTVYNELIESGFDRNVQYIANGVEITDCTIEKPDARACTCGRTPNFASGPRGTARCLHRSIRQTKRPARFG